MWRDIGERLCSLQKMDQRVIHRLVARHEQQKFYGPLMAIELFFNDQCQMQTGIYPPCFSNPWAQASGKNYLPYP